LQPIPSCRKALASPGVRDEVPWDARGGRGQARARRDLHLRRRRPRGAASAVLGGAKCPLP
ncbi:unnamed protein product, partial [Ectocarpus sp. 12 AP-2014]